MSTPKRPKASGLRPIEELAEVLGKSPYKSEELLYRGWWGRLERVRLRKGGERYLLSVKTWQGSDAGIELVEEDVRRLAQAIGREMDRRRRAALYRITDETRQEARRISRLDRRNVNRMSRAQARKEWDEVMGILRSPGLPEGRGELYYRLACALRIRMSGARVPEGRVGRFAGPRMERRSS